MPDFRSSNFKEKLIDFSIYCRERSFLVSPQQTKEAFELVDKGLALNRTLFRSCLKAIYCKRKEHFDKFNELFNRFWSRNFEEELEARKIKLQAQQQKNETSTIVFLGTSYQRPKPKKEVDAKKTAGANQMTRLRYTDFSKLKVEDQQDLESLAQELFHQMSMRLKRRQKKANSGLIDVRKTIRTNISKGFLLLDLVHKKKKTQKRKLVFLLDVSGSMDTYSFYLLKYILALKKYFHSLEFFTFSTQLTHITPMLRPHNEKAILKEISDNVGSWSSGTKIGDCLNEFVEEYGNKCLTSKHIVVILSDGLETGNVSLLRKSVREMKMRCKQLVWLNPLKGMKDYQPIQKGIVNVMPHLDAFESVHNLDSLLKLEKILMNV